MSDQQLARRLSTGDAVVIGLGSMIGAGVFSALAPAAAAAGAGLLVGLVIAGAVAFCNATSSAQLAAHYPTSGGTYVYGRERLGPWWGFLAGWAFVIGKTASCAAMALTFAAYAAPGQWSKPVAVVAVVALAAVNYFGVTRTAGLTKIIVTVVLVVLAVVVVACLTSSSATPAVDSWQWLSGGWYGVMQSAGLLFFAFGGYARIATMGEEVKNPKRSIPRAILVALFVAFAVYALVAVSILLVLGPAGVASTSDPLAQAVTGAGWEWAVILVQVGAAAASLGALLALFAGVGRTCLAMARHRDLPEWLAAVHPRHEVPHHAEMAVAVVVCVLVLVVDLRTAIGFSSFGVLLYYLIANLSAFSQEPGDRRYPQWLQVLGAVGCVVLAVTLPWSAVAVGAGVLLVGVIFRLIRNSGSPA